MKKVEFKHNLKRVSYGKITLDNGLNNLTEAELEQLKKHASYNKLTAEGIIKVLDEVKPEPKVAEEAVEEKTEEVKKPRRSTRKKKIEE